MPSKKYFFGLSLLYTTTYVCSLNKHKQQTFLDNCFQNKNLKKLQYYSQNVEWLRLEKNREKKLKLKNWEYQAIFYLSVQNHFLFPISRELRIPGTFFVCSGNSTPNTYTLQLCLLDKKILGQNSNHLFKYFE